MSHYYYIPKKSSFHTINKLETLRKKWEKIPHEGYRELICIEEQYYSFMDFVQSNIRYSRTSKNNSNGDYAEEMEIFGSPKAGILFYEIISTAKILETALWSHGIKRGILDAEKAYMLGSIMTKWQETLQPEYDSELKEFSEHIREHRNKLHPDNLHKVGKEFYNNLINQEKDQLKHRAELMQRLRIIES